jgi:hypothetical protein
MNNISNAQLLFDRQESFNDIALCLVAKSKGIEDYEERLEGNLKIIGTIIKECKRRGFDSAKYQEDK